MLYLAWFSELLRNKNKGWGGGAEEFWILGLEILRKVMCFRPRQRHRSFCQAAAIEPLSSEPFSIPVRVPLRVSRMVSIKHLGSNIGQGDRTV